MNTRHDPSKDGLYGLLDASSAKWFQVTWFSIFRAFYAFGFFVLYVAKAHGAYGQWQAVSQWPGLDFRVSNEGFNKFAGQYEWDVEFRNRYTQRIHFSFALAEPNATGNVSLKFRESLNPGEADFIGAFEFLNSSSGATVWVGEVRFGKDDIGPYASPQAVGGPGGGGGTTGGGGGSGTGGTGSFVTDFSPLQFDGLVSYQVYPNTLAYDANIKNVGNTPSGKIRFELWALPNPYNGGAVPSDAYLLRRVDDERSLVAGNTLHTFSGAPIGISKKPAPGWHYIAAILLEFRTDFSLPDLLQQYYSVQDYRNFPRQYFIGDDGFVWVDFRNAGPQTGTFNSPFSTLVEGVAATPRGGTLRVKSGSRRETVTIDKGIRIESYGGPVTIGR